MTPLPRRALRAIVATGVSATLAALPACNSHSLEAPKIAPTRTMTDDFQETLNRKIDILFMVDNSNSMRESQENLRRNFPRFMEVLTGLRDGLPDVHIAVVSSDMGAGNGDNNTCNATGGDQGIFHFDVGKGATGVTSTGLNAGQTFIASTGGPTPRNNFTGTITQVFQAIAPIGDGGCGYESQLRSVARALGADGAPAPPENTGFLRDDAYLGIVFITNEDDCSPQNPAVFTNQSTDFTMASRLGPPGDFRCAEFGYRCGGVSPSRNAPNGLVSDTMSYADCDSAEGGELIPVDTFAAAIKNLKPGRPGDIMVASIQGLPKTTFDIHWKNPATSTDPPWPEITRSCMSASDGSFATPGIRMKRFVQNFGGNGLAYSICENDFGPALTTIAEKLTQFLRPKCVAGQIALRPQSTVEDCTVTDSLKDESGRPFETRVPACADNPAARPCWRLEPGTGTGTGLNGCAPDQHLVVTDREGTPPDNLRITVSCSICIPGVADAARGCPG